MLKRILSIGVGVVVAAYLIWSFVSPRNSPGAIDSAVGSIAPPRLVGRSPSNVQTGPTAVPTHDDASVILLLNGRDVKRQSSVAASGLGLAPKEPFRLETNDASGRPVTLATGTADEHGSFGGASFKVPDNWPDGPRTIRAVGETSGRVASSEVVVAASTPDALPNVYFGKPLAKVSFQGGGFHSGEDVVVYFDSLAASPAGHVRADDSGIVRAKDIEVPPAAPGDHAFLLVGQSSGSPVRIPFSVLAFQPWLSVTDYTPQPEHSVGVIGHDFAPGEHVAVFLNAPVGPPVADGVADKTGVAKIDPAFTVPFDLRGKLAIVAEGGVSQTAATTTITVRGYTPRFTLTSYAGSPGSSIGARGDGFGHNEQVTIRFGGTEGHASSGGVTVTAQTDGRGSFNLSTPLKVPDRAQPGKTPVSIVGEHSQTPEAATFAVLAVNPWIVPIPAAGGAGRTIAIEGGGFEPGESVDLVIGDLVTAKPVTVQADVKGNVHLGGPLEVDQRATGRVAVQATGSKSGAVAKTVYVII